MLGMKKTRMLGMKKTLHTINCCFIVCNVQDSIAEAVVLGKKCWVAKTAFRGTGG
jgi:hypothetical protein